MRVHKGKTRKYVAAFDEQIQDVEWSPDGRYFIVISGQQPAQATLYLGEEGEPFFEYGQRFRNTVRFCPFSHVLIIGGFGNITKGEMDFWNIEADGTVGETEIGKAKHSCATKIDWSACGRYVLTSVLTERLKVDNGFQVFRGNGTAVLEGPIKFEELHSVAWRPHQKGVIARPDLA